MMFGLCIFLYWWFCFLDIWFIIIANNILIYRQDFLNFIFISWILDALEFVKLPSEPLPSYWRLSFFRGSLSFWLWAWQLSTHSYHFRNISSVKLQGLYRFDWWLLNYYTAATKSILRKILRLFRILVFRGLLLVVIFNYWDTSRETLLFLVWGVDWNKAFIYSLKILMVLLQLINTIILYIFWRTTIWNFIAF